MAKQKSSTEYSFKVKLKGRKSIWRTVVLRGDNTLHDLHEIIFEAFDRYDDHLYSFYFPKEPRGRDKQDFKVKEYSSPIMLEEPDPLSFEKPFNAAKTKLDSLHLKVGQIFEYLFDFGDSWLHEINVVEIEPITRTRTLPMVTERHGDSPEQYPHQEE